MVVLVKAVALERDPDLGVHLLEFAFAGGTLGQGVLGERLPDLKRLATIVASVVVGRHVSEDTGTPAGRHRTMGPCFWPSA